MDELKRTSEYRKMLPLIARAAGDVGLETQGQEIQALLLALNTHKTSADHDGRYYTETEANNRYSVLAHLHDDRYSLLAHLHDDRYYTETEADSLLAAKADDATTFTAGNGLTGGGTLAADRTFNVGAGDGISVAADSVAVNSSVVRTSRTITAGSGLTGGGDLSANRTLAVDTTDNFSWSGSHTFGGALYTGTILPSLSNTYNLGSAAVVYQKGYFTELIAGTGSLQDLHVYHDCTIDGFLALGSDQFTLNTDGTDVDVELQFYRTTGGPFSIFWNGVTAWTTKAFRPFDLIINRISNTEPSAPVAGMVWMHPNG
jgi:hypothetical protein